MTGLLRQKTFRTQIKDVFAKTFLQLMFQWKLLSKQKLRTPFNMALSWYQRLRLQWVYNSGSETEIGLE